MRPLIQKNVWLALTVVSMAVILFLAVFFGLRTGKNKAQANVIVKNVTSLVMGLDYFYSDQNRFPSAVEFADNNIMRYYFSIFPPEKLLSTSCPDNFEYRRSSFSQYEITFCLPGAYESFGQGLNKITRQK